MATNAAETVDLTFPNAPIVPVSPPAQAVTYLGQAISSTSPGGIANISIVGRITPAEGEAYVSVPVNTDAVGNFLIIVDPGTQDYVGERVQFVVQGTSFVAVQNRVFTGDGAVVELGRVVFPITGTTPTRDTMLSAILNPTVVEEGSPSSILLRRLGSERLDEAVVVQIAVSDADMALGLMTPTISATIPANENVVSVPIMTPNNDSPSMSSVVLFEVTTPTPNFTFMGNSSLVLTITDADVASAGGSCNAGDTASADNLVLLAVPLLGLTILGGFGALRGVRRRSNAHHQDKN
jgi:hypothetical protein